MRATPAQIAVRLICGVNLPQGRVDGTVGDRMKRGHAQLVRLTGRDFGYDLQAWHDHLKESRDGGYTYGRNIQLPKVMQVALASAEWREAANHLSAPET